ncbi:tRNA (guanosine(37)-N1)-methyltransferase TrmD [Desulfurobacterium crinifex]
MRFDVLTVLPGLFDCFLREGIIGKAVSSGKVKVNVVNIRDFAFDKHKVVDDVPYGGGPGMVLKPEPIFRAYEELTKEGDKPYVLLTEPWGERFNQEMAIELSNKKRIMIICGRYEGVDERVKTLVDKEVSIGDFVLTGGELPAMVIMDAVIRLIPRVLGNIESLQADSFMDRGLLGYPNYTRPAEFRGMKVPDVLLSGHHKKIELWRKEQSLRKTLERKPEIVEKLRRDGKLTEEELKILEKIEREMNREQS